MNTEFKNKVVRDLFWLVFEPSPLSRIPEGFSIPFFPVQIIDEWKKDSGSYFTDLDKRPEDLQRFVDRNKNKRLGFYCESLLSFFFQTFPGITLWLQNIQIREEKRTVGEIDFVISWQNRLIHIELAVKYYLLLPGSDPQIARNWIGPSRKDDLNKKLTKIEKRQLPLGKHSVVQKLLPSDLFNEMESFFLLKGHFFSLKNELMLDLLSKRPSPYYFAKDVNGKKCNALQRPDWLGSFYKEFDKENVSKVGSIDRPLMVKLDNNDNVFIVPDNWNDEEY